jgi:hypothetical protein
MASELWLNSDQMSKVDIYALGATFVECLEQLPAEGERLVEWLLRQLWHHNLHGLFSEYFSANFTERQYGVIANPDGSSMHTVKEDTV